MIPVIISNPSSFTIPTGLIECSNEDCGGLMHISMEVCGDCINEDSFFVSRGQRVLTHTRRSFKYGN